MPDIFFHPHVVQADEIDELGHANNVVYIAWLQADAVAHSAAQGWLFYQNLMPIGSGMVKDLLVHRIDDCTGDEMIWGVNAVDNGESGMSGFVVSMNDMIASCMNNHGH